MANRKQIQLLARGVAAWNQWRERNPKVRPNLSGRRFSKRTTRSGEGLSVDLSGIDLSNSDLSGCNFHYAKLDRANLSWADLRAANFGAASLVDANLESADLLYASFESTNLHGANLANSMLYGAQMFSCGLFKTNFQGTRLYRSTFADVDLSQARALDQCEHVGRSVVDHQTLQKSGSLPLVFLRGVGFPENLIDYLPSLFNRPIQHYSCFISYSAFDDNFAKRLHADLQDGSVRCWFAPHDMPIGGVIWEEIDSAIRLRDKLVLILSEQSIASDWVEDEVTKAFEEERKRGQTVLFPIRLDDAVMDTNEAWAAKLRARHIGDFTRWKEHDEYQKSFERVLRDLTVKKS